MNQFCCDCEYVNRETDRCVKYDMILPRNLNGNLFKCYYCMEEQNESTNKT